MGSCGEARSPWWRAWGSLPRVGAEEDQKHVPGSEGRRGRLSVEHGGNRRPFMRGIMIHSLMARGVPFEDAYQTANEIRARLGGRSVVERAELAKAVTELLGDEVVASETPPASDEIIVVGGGKGLPFSKGILSQSLLAAAIDPNDAFDVAREIERELISRGSPEIERHELRRLAYEALGREKGAQTAERYLVWRKFQDPDRPVIVLLGGAAGVGKTSLALEVAQRLGVGRILSTDSIRQIMRLMLSPEFAPAIHGSSYDAFKLLSPDSLGDEPVLDGFRAQAETVSVGIRASMDRAVSENASMVIDGVAIVPGVLDLAAYSEAADVIFLVVATLDEDAFRNRFEARAAGQRRRQPHRYLENLDGILKIQDHLLELADRYDVPIVDNASFDRSVLLIIRHVAETLRARGELDASSLL